MILVAASVLVTVVGTPVFASIEDPINPIAYLKS
jgi:hypothetical protein